MNMELHSTGASFVAAREDNNPRDFVAQVIKDCPGGTRKEQFEAFRLLLDENSDEYQRAVDWYFFVNMHDYMTTSRNSRRGPAVPAEMQAAGEDRRVEAIKAKIVMLDYLMPIGDGKPMRDCTGAEMARLGNRYQKIADKVGKAKTVGEVLSEDQVRALMK